MASQNRLHCRKNVNTLLSIEPFVRQQAQGPKTPRPIRSEHTEWVRTWYALGTLVYGLGYYAGISLTLVYSSTNMSKSVWTSGFWKPLVHKNMSNFWNNIFHKFSIPKSRRALDPGRIRASLGLPARTLYAQGVDE